MLPSFFTFPSTNYQTLITYPLQLFFYATPFNMASKSKILEKQDRERDAAFNTAMHGEASGADGGFRAMLRKGGGTAAQRAATEEYFKHWDNQDAKDETEETRAVSSILHPKLA